METLIIVFMAFIMAFCVFVSILIIRDMIKDHKAAKEAQTAKTVEVKYVQKSEVVLSAPPLVADTQTTMTKQEETPARAAPRAEVEEEVASLETGQTGANEQAETLAGDVNSVSFSHTARTHKEKVEALSQEKRALYDEIASYAAAQKGAKCILNDRYEEYKQGNNRLVRLEIKRESIVCKFDLPNTDFKNYINENKVSVKQSATSIKIVDEAAVKVAKDSIDIAVKTIEAEKEYKKQLAKERRARKSA